MPCRDCRSASNEPIASMGAEDMGRPRTWRCWRQMRWVPGDHECVDYEFAPPGELFRDHPNSKMLRGR